MVTRKVMEGYVTEGAIEMVRVTVEVRNGASRFEVTVRAQSISRALGLVAARYPEGDARVVFPIDPEGFFAGGDPAGGAETVGLEPPRAA